MENSARKKPWTDEPRGRQLEAFVGAFGVRTSQFKTTKELIWFGCRLFGIEPVGVDSVESAASSIEALGKKERSARARTNRAILFPTEDFSRPTASVEHPTQHQLDRMMENSEPALIDGEPFGIEGQLDVDPAQLLRKVVSAVISGGHGEILWEFPEVLAFFGSRIPDRSEVAGHHNVDERMFEARSRWPNAKRTLG